MAKKLNLFKSKTSEKGAKMTKAAATIKSTAIVSKPKVNKFSAEDEARIQAEVERIKRAKHEQMIAEEIRNRAANI